MEVINLRENYKNYTLTKNKFAINFIKKVLNDKLSNKEFIELFEELRKNSKDIGKDWNYLNDNVANEGGVDVGSDPGRSIVERGNNSLDSVMELLHYLNNGSGNPQSPSEAAEKWLHVPQTDGLASFKSSEITKMSNKYVTIKALQGDGLIRNRSILEIKDKGIGISQQEFKDGILKIHGSQKIKKLYVMGHFGMGGSSSFAYTEHATVIVSRKYGSEYITFTVIWYDENDHDPSIKVNSYMYLTENNLPLTVKSSDVNIDDFEHGTIVKHFGYDLTNYSKALSKGSVYTLLQKNMFNPTIPIKLINWLPDKDKSKYVRSIIGARSALINAESRDKNEGLQIEHREKINYFNLSNKEYGSIGIEYWVVKSESESSLATYIHQDRPVIFTNNGQNQNEVPSTFIKSDLEFPFLDDRMVIHINCSALSMKAKKNLFSSTRERSKEGALLKEILQLAKDYLKSDETLKILNKKAAEESIKKRADGSVKEVQKRVAKMLKFTSGRAASILGGSPGSGNTNGSNNSNRSNNNRNQSKPIEIKDVPTFIRIRADEDKDIKIYQNKKKFITIETDAHHRFDDNIEISLGEDIQLFNRTPLNKGRLRIYVGPKADVPLDNKGTLIVNLKINDLDINISDQKTYVIAEAPLTANKNKPQMPEIEAIEVDGKQDNNWKHLFEEASDRDKFNENDVSFRYLESDGTLLVYYNTKFSRFVSSVDDVKRRGGEVKLVELKLNYKSWLCATSYLEHSAKEEDNLIALQYSSDDDKNLSRIQKNSAAGAALLAAEIELFKRD